jgi:hypothetical protein
LSPSSGLKALQEVQCVAPATILNLAKTNYNFSLDRTTVELARQAKYSLTLYWTGV